VLTPAGRLGEELQKQGEVALVASDLARLHAIQAELMTTFDDVPWPSPDPKATILDLYNRALELDNSQSEYYLGRAWASIALGKRAWSDVSREAKADAARAIDKAPSQPGGYHLDGYLHHLDSRRERRADARIAALRRALDSYEKALNARGPTPDQLPILRVDRSNAYLELANAEREKSEIQANLVLAEKEAQLAIASPNRSHPERALMALGNALEDFELLLGVKGKYAEAASAFADAHAVRPRDPQPLINLLRIQYRRMRFAREDGVPLREAINKLRPILKPSLPVLDRVRAHEWLGLATAALGDLRGAEADFEKARELIRPQDGDLCLHSAEWVRYLVSVELAEGEESLSKGHQDLLTRTVRARAGTIKDRYPEGAAFAIGQSYEIDHKPKLALDAYKSAIPELAQTTPAHLELLLEKGELQVEGRFLGMLPAPDLATLHSLRGEADRVLALSNGPGLTDELKGRSWGLSGLIEYRYFQNTQYDNGKRAAAGLKAMEQLRKALSSSAKNSSSAILWCRAFADVGIKKLVHSAPAEQATLTAEIKAYLKHARDLDKKGLHRGNLDDLKRDLDEALEKKP
jgi:hypothetical protein